MVKIFKEEDRLTVVLPRNPGAEETVQRILEEVYGCEEKQEIEVEGLVPDNKPDTSKGVQIIDQAPKRQYIRTNAILQDPRNPYDCLPYEAFKEHGISAMIEYSKMNLRTSKNDTQISLELFKDFKKYLIEINNEDYMSSVDISEIKNIITVISTKIYQAPIQAILKRLAIDSLDTFLNEASDDQLRSAAVKLVNDTIKILN